MTTALIFLLFVTCFICSFIQPAKAEEYGTISIYIKQQSGKPASRPKASMSFTKPTEMMYAPKPEVKAKPKTQAVKKHPFFEDAVAALRSLGHKKVDACKIVSSKINGNYNSLEDLVMECLK